LEKFNFLAGWWIKLPASGCARYRTADYSPVCVVWTIRGIRR
jgi:hypothetical protein